MKSQAPEFSRPYAAARVPARGSYEKLAATLDECATLAKRFGVPEVHQVKAELLVSPWRGGGLKVKGEVHCDMAQVSVISLEAFREVYVWSVERYFLPESRASEQGDEADLIIDGHIDLGEVVAETIALEMDPYPRKPGEFFAANDNG